MENKFRTFGILLLFIAFISFPLINDTFHLIADTDNRENRELAKKPALDINYLDPYPADFESYYNDHFTWRFRMVQYFNSYNRIVLKKSPFPSVVVGYNDWLYPEGYEMESYRGMMWFSDSQSAIIATELEAQRKYLEEHNCKFYFMLTPSKSVIHTENIPHTQYRYTLKSFGQNFEDYLRKNTKINVISLFEPFQKIAKTDQLYYKHDVHWNSKGGFYASVITHERIGQDFPTVKPLKVSDFKVTETVVHGGDLIGLIGGDDTNEDSDFDFVSLKTNRPIVFGPRDYSQQFIYKFDAPSDKRPSLMLVSDSYSNKFFPFVSLGFSKTVSVFDLWQYGLPKALIEKEKPDVYILMVHEHLVRNFFERPQ